ncbi:MAG TPA: YezD family protein [Verrucomicrobiae bacterium]|nr:YezD family protein [Verrucomicrobiae bacterium]
MNAAEIKSGEHADRNDGWLEIVRRQVASLRYGVVQVVVHDSRVTQIDKTERVRLENLSPGNHLRPTGKPEV